LPVDLGVFDVTWHRPIDRSRKQGLARNQAVISHRSTGHATRFA
jgi:hypothetical protein